MTHHSYSIDVGNKIATFTLNIGGVPEAFYTYDNGMVTMSTRPNPVSVTVLELLSNLTDLNNWLSVIRTDMAIPRQVRGLFTEELKKTNDTIEGLFKFGASVVTDMEYELSTGLVTTQPRIEITLPFMCFTAWAQFLYRGVKEMQTFI